MSLQVFVATTNIGSGQGLSRSITYHPYSDGTKLVNVLDSSDTVTVNGGAFTVTIEGGMPKIYHPVTSELTEEREREGGGGLDHGEIGLVVSAGLVATLVILLSGVVVYMVSYRVRRGRSYSEL
ncbi:hypothetical protein GBAR_LOCUS6895 [Geodia barretti]|uniref:Alpha-amylase domain-containing protein n=1 Tax=Geodia barretti TaxID=519541 RepID=A0AA35RGV6_GEOBA|nr:hypothetical protein GBAR_LOCUS6895 [Geodia barretti]